MPDSYTPGTECTVNGKGDLYCDYDSRDFIDAQCVIVKKTHSGLYQIALKDNPKRVYSVAKQNIILYEHITYATGFTIKCTPKEQLSNALNYLITGHPLGGKSLEGVTIEFIKGKYKGKKAVFKTELYELIEE